MTEAAPTPTAATSGAPRSLHVVMYGIAALLLIAACWVQIVAPTGATVEMPTGRRGQRATEVGLWALYIPFGLALLAAWYATIKLPLQRLGRQRIAWIILLAVGPAVLFAIVAYDALN